MKGFTVTLYTNIKDERGNVVHSSSRDFPNQDLNEVAVAIETFRLNGGEMVSQNRMERTGEHANGIWTATEGIRVLETK